MFQISKMLLRFEVIHSDCGRKIEASFHNFTRTCSAQSSSAIAETALRGGSVLAKSGRRYSADIIGLSSTTVT